MKSIITNTLNILNSNERKKLAVLIMLNLFITIIDIASLAVMVLFISFYTQGSRQAIASIRFIGLFRQGPLLPISLFLGLFILKNIAGYLIFVAQNRFVFNVASRVSTVGLLKYLEGSYSAYTDTDSSVYIRKIMHQPIEFAHYVLTGILQITTESIIALLTMAGILLFNAQLLLLLALVLLPAVLIIANHTKRKLREARMHTKASSEKAQQYLHESLAGYIESNIYDKKEFFAGRYSLFLQKMTGYLSDIETTQGVPSRLVETFAVLGLFLLVLASKYSGGNSVIQLINIGAFMAAAYKIIPGIVKISNNIGQVKTYAYTVNELLNSEEEKPKAGERLQHIETICFNNVSFNNNGKALLDNFNFKITKGGFIGISGPSGKGKTTFVNLLLGFLEETKGDIVINDIAVNANERQRYWGMVSYAQQRPFLINDTIKANITLSDNNINDIRLAEAIKATGLDEFIRQFTEGYNKNITEQGRNISGGQRQRIALARALYKDSDLIILDEPFSEIDSGSETHILDYLKLLSENGKMIIMITHKKENLAYCDKTYFIG